MTESAAGEAKTPQTFVMHLQRRWFDLVQAGTKTIEARPFDGDERKLRVGDCIRFRARDNVEQQHLVRVKRLQWYASFQNMLEKEKEKALPGADTSVSDGVQLYHGFPRYEARAKAHGVIAIELESATKKKEYAAGVM